MGGRVPLGVIFYCWDVRAGLLKKLTRSWLKFPPYCIFKVHIILSRPINTAIQCNNNNNNISLKLLTTIIGFNSTSLSLSLPPPPLFFLYLSLQQTIVGCLSLNNNNNALPPPFILSGPAPVVSPLINRLIDSRDPT